MAEHPESFPVNTLVPIEGTPLEKNDVRIFSNSSWEKLKRAACTGSGSPEDHCNRTYRLAQNNHPARGW
jgi:hypothetical protein